MANYKHIRREFLNAAPGDLVHTSYALVHVEDSERGTNPHGNNVLNIADCKRVVTLDFYLGNQAARDASIAKINLLLEVLGGFREALINEAYAIAKVEKKKKGALRK
jgi:hypothetical protein